MKEDRRRAASSGGRKESDNTCPICQEAVSETDKAVLVPCCHDFHNACIDTLTETCPECQQTVTQVKWNIKSDSEFESRDIASGGGLPFEDRHGTHLSHHVRRLHLPIPAIEMMST